MVPIGLFETVMPQDYLPTQLLRALIVEDIISAVELGALSLMKKIWHCVLSYRQANMSSVIFCVIT